MAMKLCLLDLYQNKCNTQVIQFGFVLNSQAIEAAIELDLNTVEAGAQGEHKIQRGYIPVTTYSCHYLIDESFQKPIQEFLTREATQVLPSMHIFSV